MSSIPEPSTMRSFDDRAIAAMRLVLATAALPIIYLDPLEHGYSATATYAFWGLYLGYGAVLYILTLRHSPFLVSINRFAHWVDVGSYATLLALGHSTSSIFFFFFFPILVAGFRWGLASGLWVALVSAALATVGSVTSASSAPGFTLNRFLLQPFYLLILGYMLAYRGGFEITLKRRLALLKEVTRLSNPRFGVDQTIGSVMEQLRAFYQAENCLIVMGNSRTGAFGLRRSDAHHPEGGAQVQPIPPALGERLLGLPPDLAVIYTAKPRAWWRLPLGVRYYACEVTTGTRRVEWRSESEALAATLGVESFLTVPFRYRDEPAGRLYLTAQRQRAFDGMDVDFLLQVIEHVVPMLDNVRLVDQLASSAAEEERRRIARDLHDSVIQPYIGLQMGLIASSQKLAAGADAGADLAQLIELVNAEITGLRGYVRGLKVSDGGEGSLLPAVQRFAERFAGATGIAVQVEVEGDLRINDRLAAEAFQMAAEGLSNIRKHTRAQRATVRLARQNGSLLLRIENESAGDAPFSAFTPRSITERAAALGGRARVEQSKQNGTTVVVEIPL